MPLKLKPLSTLPKSSQAYRIDAIGNIQRNPNCSTNHLINILVSPVNEGIEYKEIFEGGAVDSSQQTCYQISAGELFLFSPGCVIRNGRLVWTPLLSNITENLSIAPERIRFVVPGNNVEDSEFFIPFDVYRFGLASKTPLLAIERDGDPYSVLIPTMEILRFYYSGSSKLNQAIFSSKLIDLNELINLRESSFDRDTRVLNICLRDNYPNGDAGMLGHWYADEYAHNQVLNVWNALIKFKQNDRVSYLPLEIGFPFKGDTRVRAQGIELPTPEGAKNKRKLILTLLKCSHPRPFTKVIFTRDNEGGPGAQDVPGTEHREKVGYRQRLTVTSDALPEGTNDPFSNPSIDIQPDFLMVDDQRFPKVEIEKKIKDHTTYAGSQPPTEAPGDLPNQSSSSATHGATDAVSISIVPLPVDSNDSNAGDKCENEPLPIDFDTFHKVVAELEYHPCIESTQRVVISSEKKDSHATLSHFPTQSSHKYIKWSVVFKNNKPRARQAILIKVISKFGTHYLLEIERKEYHQDDGSITADREFATYVFSNKTCSSENQAILESLFLSLAESAFKNYKKKFKALGFTVFSKKHSGNVSERAALIIEKMENRWREINPGDSLMMQLD